jgi:hypothetical protein
MKRINLLGLAAMAAMTVAAPAWGLAGGVPDNGTSANSHAQSHATPTTPTTTSATTPTTPSQAKAYGVLCNKESKKHVAGQKGTPFSQCVTALTKLANGESKSPAKACAKESKKHVAGQKGTPFSQCVSAAAKLHSGAHK